MRRRTERARFRKLMPDATAASAITEARRIWALAGMCVAYTNSLQASISNRLPLIVVVVDASNLQRNLYYATQVVELGHPTIIALNMVDVAEANADSGPAELNHVTHLSNAHAIGQIIRLHFLGSPPMDACTLVGNDGIAERATDDAWPHQFVGSDCGGRADIRLRIKP